MLKSLRNSLLTGLVIILPLSVTLFILYFLITKIGNPVSEVLFAPILKEFSVSLTNSPLGNIVLDFIATLLLLSVIATIGFFSRFFFGKFAINISEALIHKIPIAKQIYNTVKQIVDTFSKQKKAVFQEVVLVEFPRKGMYAVGFLTSDAQGEIQARTGDFVLNIFIPTTPNPTSGFLVMVPKEQVTRLDMSVAEGMKLIISGGAVSPEWKQKQID